MIASRTMLLVLSLLLFLQGCVISRGRIGNPIDERNLEQIQKGITHRDQVVELLGAPDRINQAPDRDIFQYYYYDAKSPALILLAFNILTLNVKSDNLYIFFDKQGVVQDILYGKRTDGVDFTLRPWGK